MYAQIYNINEIKLNILKFVIITFHLQIYILENYF